MDGGGVAGIVIAVLILCAVLFMYQYSYVVRQAEGECWRVATCRLAYESSLSPFEQALLWSGWAALTAF